MTRKYVETNSQNKEVPGKKFSLYSYVRSKDKEAKATVIMCHGYGESSDNYLETAIHHAMNGFEVHAIDFMGQGLASGPKNGHFGIQEHHN